MRRRKRHKYQDKEVKSEVEELGEKEIKRQKKIFKIQQTFAGRLCSGQREGQWRASVSLHLPVFHELLHSSFLT